MKQETKRPKIYIAGPYTKGDVAQNVRQAIYAAERIAARGMVPYVPHLTHFWHLVEPHEISFWYEYDNEWLKVCDALYRLPGESAGADKEVVLAYELGIPVFTDLDKMIEAMHAFGDPSAAQECSADRSVCCSWQAVTHAQDIERQ